MVIAINFFESEMAKLADIIGFPVKPDSDGNYAVELQDESVLAFTFSTTNDRFGLHCLLLCAPYDINPRTLREALWLNAWLAQAELGTLCYSDEDEGIIYTWTGHCQDHAGSLGILINSFIDKINTIKSRLTDIRDDEYLNALGDAESDLQMQYQPAQAQSRLAALSK